MIKLLILEDIPEVRYGIYDYLKQNYEVFVTKDEKEVFRILNQTNIDLIIFDFSIISINLKQFVAALKESNNKILTMIQLDDNDKKCLFQSDIDDYMNKPLDMMELQFRIEHLLKKKKKVATKGTKTAIKTGKSVAKKTEKMAKESVKASQRALKLARETAK